MAGREAESLARNLAEQKKVNAHLTRWGPCGARPLEGRVRGGGEGVLRPDVGRQMGATSGKYTRAMLGCVIKLACVAGREAESLARNLAEQKEVNAHALQENRVLPESWPP